MSVINEIRQLSKLSLNICIHSRSYRNHYCHKHYASDSSFPVSSHMSVWIGINGNSLIHSTSMWTWYIDAKETTKRTNTYLFNSFRASLEDVPAVKLLTTANYEETFLTVSCNYEALTSIANKCFLCTIRAVICLAYSYCQPHTGLWTVVKWLKSICNICDMYTYGLSASMQYDFCIMLKRYFTE